MDDRRSDRALTDAMLERQIEQALAVDPSPEFLARVRAGIASERAPVRPGLISGLVSGPTWGFRRAIWAAGSAIVVLIAVVILWRVGAPRRAALVDSSPSSRPDVLIAARPVSAPYGSLVQALPDRSGGTSGRRSISVSHNALRVRSAEPEVLIAKDESEALRRLMRGLSAGVVDPSTLSDAPGVVVVAIPPPGEIVLPPLMPLPPVTVEPLGSLEREEGVRQ